jgi:hypothetical protein
VHCSRGFVCVAPGMATQAAPGLMPAATHVHFLPHQSPQSPVWQTGSQPVAGTVFEKHGMSGGVQGALASGTEPESPASVVAPVSPAPPVMGAKIAFAQATVKTNGAARQHDDRLRGGFLMSQPSGGPAPWRAGVCHTIPRKATMVLCAPPK